jgi:hypothetical protein
MATLDTAALTSSSSSSSSSMGTSTSTLTENKDLDTRAFAQWMGTAEKRALHREQIKQILLKYPKGPLAECKDYVIAITKLVSAATLWAIATKKGWKLKGGQGTRKKDVVEKLLKDNWALPSDDELVAIYLEAGPKPPRKSKKTKSDDDDDDFLPSDGDDVEIISNRSMLEGSLHVSSELPSMTGSMLSQLSAALSMPAAVEPSRSSTERDLGLINFSLGQALTALVSESRLRTKILEDKIRDKDEQVNFGTVPRIVKKAIKEGTYTSLCHFWNEAAAAERRATL